MIDECKTLGSGSLLISPDDLPPFHNEWTADNFGRIGNTKMLTRTEALVLVNDMVLSGPERVSHAHCGSLVGITGFAGPRCP